jgi:electron transfer flavoprotein alpha subunit
LGLRELWGGQVIALTMGPPAARQALVDALALGCDSAIHLLDDSFAGSDTLATSRILAAACRRLGVDLILCGRSSTDSGTGVVPGLLAALLDLPFLPVITRLECSEDGRTLVAVRELEDGFETVTCRTPAVLSAAERLTKPLTASSEARAAAAHRAIEVWDRRILGLPLSDVGANGSPTHIEALHAVEAKRRGERIDPGDELGPSLHQIVQRWVKDGVLQARSDPALVPESGPEPRGASIWVVLECSQEGVRPASLEILAHTARQAADLHAKVTAVLLGQSVESMAPALAGWGADHILLAEAPDLGPHAVEAHAALLLQLLARRPPDAVLIPASAYGRDLAPRLSALLGLGIAADCADFVPDATGFLRLLRPASAGNVVAAITCSTRPILATLTPGILPRSLPLPSRRASIERLTWRGDFLPRRRTLAIEADIPEGIALETAEVVFGVGMGVGGPEGVSRVQALASSLGARLAATRRVVDAGWLPRQLQVGLTGRSIAPRLYLAIGVSGKSYHAVGVQRAGRIVAINSDPPASLLAMADEILVGDWGLLLPPLVDALADVLRPPST